jgi:VanZ family protein
MITSWLLVVLWAGFIYYLSSIPSFNTGWGVWDFIFRKIAHVVEFAVLTALLWHAFSRTWPEKTKSNLIIWSLGLAVLYAASDEFHQLYVPGRGASVGDVLIDTCGVILCLLMLNRGMGQKFLGTQ